MTLVILSSPGKLNKVRIWRAEYLGWFDFPKKKALAIEIKLILDTLDMIFSLKSWQAA